MAELSEKEIKVLRILSENSDRSQKTLAALTDMSESEFSRAKKELFAKGVLQKFTIAIDFRRLGFPDLGVLFASVVDKKIIQETVDEIAKIPEAIAVFEVFGQAYDLVIKIMARNNEHLRNVTNRITSMENIRAGENTFTIIYSRVFKDHPGVPVDLLSEMQP